MNTYRTTLMQPGGRRRPGGGWRLRRPRRRPPPHRARRTVTAADPDLATGLQFAREEERMARDLYQALADKYDGALPFSRITLSEQRHFDAVGALLDRYDVADPADGRKAGSYADATLQNLYDGWLADGRSRSTRPTTSAWPWRSATSPTSRARSSRASRADVTQVFTALLNGSQHHLAAFEAAADGQVLGLQLGTGPRNGFGPGGQGQGYGPGIRTARARGTARAVRASAAATASATA